MQFNSRKVDKTQAEIVKESANEIIAHLRLSLHRLPALEGGAIRRLALELRKLFLDAEYGDERNLSLFDFAFDTPEFPSVTNVNQLLDEFWQFGSVTIKEAGIPRRRSLKRRVGFATSLMSADGTHKPILKFTNQVDSKTWLATSILILGDEDAQNYEYTIEDIIFLVGSKDAAHVDARSFDDPSKPQEIKYQLLYKLKERFSIILGLIEQVLYVHAQRTSNIPLPTIISHGKNKGHICFRTYGTEQPIDIEGFVCINTNNNLPLVFLPFIEKGHLEMKEPYNLLSFGSDLSLEVQPDKNITLTCKGEKTTVGKLRSKVC